jgi:hypothetical protein
MCGLVFLARYVRMLLAASYKIFECERFHGRITLRNIDVECLLENAIVIKIHYGLGLN